MSSLFYITSARRLAAAEVREHGQDATVVLGGRLETQLAQDDADVALDRSLGQAELVGDRDGSTVLRPSVAALRARGA